MADGVLAVAGLLGGRRARDRYRSMTAQVLARGLARSVDDPVLGPIETMSSAFRYAGSPFLLMSLTGVDQGSVAGEQALYLRGLFGW